MTVMTQTIDQYQREIITYPLYIPSAEFEDENWTNLIAQYLSSVQQSPKQKISPQINMYKCFKDIGTTKIDPVSKLIVQNIYSAILENDIQQTETISNEELEDLVSHNVPNVIFSEKAAAKLQSKKVSAFIPISARDLIWLEAQSMDDYFDE
jgi:hypothetical protein